MNVTYIVLLFALTACIITTIKLRKLTVTAAITGGFIAVFLFAGTQYTGVVMMATFFILANIATSWKMHEKASKGIAEKNKGRRTTAQVIANGGIAGILGLCAWLYPQHATMCRVMIAASLSSATADTLSSELGNLYGSRFYNIITFKKDMRGLDGVISIEGSLIGLAGSIVIAVIYAIGFGWNTNMLIIIVAGTIGNIVDSIIGATLERSNYLNNNTVNFLNTSVAALIAFIAMYFLHHHS